MICFQQLMDQTPDEKEKFLSFQMKRELKLELSSLFQGLHPRQNRFSILIPSKVSSSWFFHHSIGGTAVCYLPPNLLDDKNWVGLELYVVFNRGPSIFRDDFKTKIPSEMVVDIYAHGIRTVPILTYSVVIRDDLFGSLCMVSHVPRESFPKLLNQSLGISILFEPLTHNIEIQKCGTKLLFEQDSDLLIQAIVEPAFERPEVLHLPHDEAQIHIKFETREDKNAGKQELQPFGHFFSMERELIESLQKLLTTKQLEEEETPSSFTKWRLSLAPKRDYKEFESISLHSGSLFLNDWDCIQEAVGKDTSRYLECSFNHLNIMIETLLNYFRKTRDAIAWKRNLGFMLKEFFKCRTFVTLSLKGHTICTSRPFDPCSTFNFCFPRKEILRLFEHRSSASIVRMSLPTNLYDDNNWRGIAICAAFSANKHPSSSKISFKLQCNLTTNGCRLDVVPMFSITKDKFKLFHTGGFIWLTFIPRGLLSELIGGTNVEADIVHDCSELILKNCGIHLLYEEGVEEFKQTIVQCWTSFFDDLEPIYQFVEDHEEILYQELDEDVTYNSCFPPSYEIQEWFEDKFVGSSFLRWLELPINLFTDQNWIGLTLYGYFSYPDEQSTISVSHDMDPHNLMCHLKIAKPGDFDFEYLHQYQTTSEELNWLNQHGGFIWISYLPRCWFMDMIKSPSQLSQCGCIEASFASNKQGLRALKCGIRLVYLNDRLEFKYTINRLILDTKWYNN